MRRAEELSRGWFFTEWIRQKLKGGGYWVVRSPSAPDFHLQGSIDAADLVMIHQAMSETLAAYRLDGGHVPEDAVAEIRKYRPPQGWYDVADRTFAESRERRRSSVPPPLPPLDEEDLELSDDEEVTK